MFDIRCKKTTKFHRSVTKWENFFSVRFFGESSCQKRQLAAFRLVKDHLSSSQQQDSRKSHVNGYVTQMQYEILNKFSKLTVTFFNTKSMKIKP